MLLRNCLFLLYVGLIVSAVVASSYSSTFSQPDETRQYTISPQTNNLFTLSAQQQCSCSNCQCNGQQTCPKPVSASSYVVLSSMEDCAASNKVPGIGLVNIISTSNSNGFKYYIVDESNKNLAMNGQAFQYSSYKSSDEATTCVSDPRPSFRYPSQVPGKVYLIAKSTNLVMNTDVRFNIQMSCTIPAATSVRVSSKPTTYSKYYVGQKITWSYSFLNQFNDVDTWQKGILSYNGVTGRVDAGVGSFVYTPTSSGSISLSVTYTPDASVYGTANVINSQSIQLVQMATRGSLEVVKMAVIGRPFQVKYTIYDDDGSVTPMIDLTKLSFKGDTTTKLTCSTPDSTSGSGSVSCTITSSETPIAVVIMQFDGATLSASSNIGLSDQPIDNGDNGKNGWINYQTVLVAIVILCIVVIGVVLAAAIAAFVIWKRRRAANAGRIKLPDQTAEDLEA